MTADAIAADPFLGFEPDAAGRWSILERATGREFLSPMDQADPEQRDVPYVGRLPFSPGSLFVVAGVHAIGSVGAFHYLTGHAAELYADVGDGPWSAVVESTHDGAAITSSALVYPASSHA